MKSYLPALYVVAALPLLFIGSCQKEVQDSQNTGDTSLLAKASVAETTTGPYGVCGYEFSETSLMASGWKRVFNENFDTDFANWNIWHGGAYNYELQLYQPQNLSLQEGLLKIDARQETKEGATLPSDPTTKEFSYTSGRIESKTHFSASATTPKVRMVARIKLPYGSGLWPAFWSYGDPWPTQGEIDILEARGNEPNVYHTAYWYGRKSGVNEASQTEASIQTVNLMDCFHVYEMIWEKNKLTFLLDGQVVNEKTGGLIPNMFRKKQRVVLNLAVGGAFFNPPPTSIEPGTMEVDWVKVFTSK